MYMLIARHCALQTPKKTYVQLDCSQSVNCITSRESAVHVLEVAANSSSVRIAGGHWLYNTVHPIPLIWWLVRKYTRKDSYRHICSGFPSGFHLGGEEGGGGSFVQDWSHDSKEKNNYGVLITQRVIHTPTGVIRHIIILCAFHRLGTIFDQRILENHSRSTPLLQRFSRELLNVAT